MRVVVTGATGNVGTSVLASLGREPEVTEVVGLARRLPEGLELPKVRWQEADVTTTELAPIFEGADAVVHLAWAIQPSHDEEAMERVNVFGSERVFGAAATAGVGALVYASSVGAYSAGPKDEAVDESWPTAGIPSSHYGREKARVERLLDEVAAGQMRVVRLRPGLIFKRAAASEIRRFFLGPLLPSMLVRPRLIPFVPDVPGLRFQAVHADDVGDAYARAVVRQVEGAFNIAAEPVIGPDELARLLRARKVKLPAKALRTAAALSWRAHLQPADPGWIDLALGVPLMDSGRARRELGWEPRASSLEALGELLLGIRESAGGDTPPLDRGAGGPLRLGELASGVGRRNRSPWDR